MEHWGHLLSRKGQERKGKRRIPVNRTNLVWKKLKREQKGFKGGTISRYRRQIAREEYTMNLKTILH